MDIGRKIREARIKADLTQEQAAEALGVSRQTISNWENEKTYPDIISVVKISDLYQVSLDRLLKEEPPVSDYLEYLEESTNVVRSRDKLSKQILITTYLAIWSFALIVFWFFANPSDAMGYSFMFLWILLPVTTFVVSLVVGRHNYRGTYKWFLAVIMGIMYMGAEYATFSASYMAASGDRTMPQFMMALVGAGISLAGLALGTMLHNRAEAKRRIQ